MSLILIGHRRSNALGQVPDSVDYLRYTEVVEFDILDARRAVALQRGVIDDDQLDPIVAEAGGSACFGVQALCSAVDLALDYGHTTVTEADVDDCFARANERIGEQRLESFGRQHQLVYRAIREYGFFRPQQIYEHYQELGGTNTRQATVKYRKKLDKYELIEQTVDGLAAVDETLAAPR